MATQENCAATGIVKSLTIVIPALNEEQGIETTIRAIPRQDLETMGYAVQILVADNGSTDRTADLARQAGADIVLESRRGYGRALKTGFNSAIGDVVITADADATYPLESIPLLVGTLANEQLDFLTTNRFARLDQGAMSRQNLVGNTILTLAARLLFGLNIRDVESGMWVFRKDILDKLQLHSDSWPLSHEIKIEACCYAKCRWKEVPIRYRARTGQTKLLNSWKVGLIDLLHMAKKRVVR
jgi:glycosyltransferase involved in cell wall biosynthesis